MSEPLVIVGVLLLVFGFFIGIKKQTWLLSGFNYRRVKDQDKLAKLVGTYNLAIGAVMLVAGLINYTPSEKILFAILVIGYVILLGYVNTQMVE